MKRMKGFDGLTVLALETRRAQEIAKLIGTYGGKPVTAPSMREVLLESNDGALDFAARLFQGDFDLVIFLTGVGTRAITNVVEAVHPRGRFVAALQSVKVVPRGPKPLAVLRELGVSPALVVPEPNTWRELLRVLDEAADLPQGFRLKGLRVAVQEYGVSNPELLAGLAERGACVTRVPVYQWALPEDLTPLRAGVEAVSAGEIGVVLFTTSVQVIHLFQVAGEMDLEKSLAKGLHQAVVASIGPTTSEELRGRGVIPDLEASHPKMGILVREAAERGPDLYRQKRAGASAC
jgi:uroporphyrinogen-III synthase